MECAIEQTLSLGHGFGAEWNGAGLDGRSKVIGYFWRRPVNNDAFSSKFTKTGMEVVDVLTLFLLAAPRKLSQTQHAAESRIQTVMIRTMFFEYFG